MGRGESFASILAAAQAGAEWALADLYAQFNPRLERYFAARAPTSGEDLAAETWIGVARALREFRGDEKSFRSWLFTIGYRRLADHWKQTASDPDPVDPSAMTAWAGSSDPEAVVIEALSAREAARRIVGCLSADQADVVLLRLLGDLDAEQVGEVLGKRPGAVRALQHRAVQKLKEEFSLEGVTE